MGNDKKWLIKASSWKCCKIAVIQEVNGRVSQKTTYQRPHTSSRNGDFCISIYFKVCIHQDWYKVNKKPQHFWQCQQRVPLAPFNFLCAESPQICNLGEEKAPVAIWFYWNTTCTVEGADPRFPTNLAELYHLKSWAPRGKKRPVRLLLTVLTLFYQYRIRFGCGFLPLWSVKSCETQVAKHLLDADAHQMG